MNQQEIFNQRLAAATDKQRERFEAMMKKYEAMEFNDIQKRYLLWLAGTDKETIETFESIFDKFGTRANRAKYTMTAYVMKWKHGSGGHFPDRTSNVPLTVYADNQETAVEKAKIFLKKLPKNDYWEFVIDEIIIE